MKGIIAIIVLLCTFGFATPTLMEIRTPISRQRVPERSYDDSSYSDGSDSNDKAAVFKQSDDFKEVELVISTLPPIAIVNLNSSLTLVAYKPMLNRFGGFKTAIGARHIYLLRSAACGLLLTGIAGDCKLIAYELEKSLLEFKFDFGISAPVSTAAKQLSMLLQRSSLAAGKRPLVLHGFLYSTK